MRVYGIFKKEMLIPYLIETLIDLYEHSYEAELEVKKLNADNEFPLESDSYGPISGCEYFMIELEVL